MRYEINYPEDVWRKFERILYPAGELQFRLMKNQLDDISQATEIVVTCRIVDGNVMHVALISDAIQEINRGKASMTLILPYLPYGRADRRFVQGDCYGLKVFGSMLDNCGFDKILTVDAHSSISHGVISNLVNVNPLPIIKTVIELLPKDLTILLPDQGAVRYGLKNYVQCEKHRDSGTGVLSGFSVPPFGTKAALIVDDICDGGGTFIGIANAMRDRNVELYLYVTHGIFSKGVHDLISKFHKIYTTDSFPQEYVDEFYQYPSNGLIRVPVGGLVNQALMPVKDVWETASTK